MSEVVYQRKERYTIQRYKESESLYIVRDVATGIDYIMDKDFFEERFEAIPPALDEPIHTEVWKKLEEQGVKIQQLKNRINTVMNDMRYERHENNELRKKLNMKRKPPYRNGRKRGSRGRNG